MAAEPTTVMVQAARGGERGAVALVIERFTPWLLLQARYRLRGRLEALVAPEDLVQETWLIALPRLADLRPRDGRLTPVLVRFLATTLRNRLRQQLERHLTGRHAATASVAEDRLLLGTVGTACSQAIVRERAELLWRELRQLSERDQAVLVLRGLEGAPFAVVASVLRIDEGAAAAAYRRACERLRERLDPLLRDDLDD
ncbi:MAG: hypothetical protein IPK26_03610 [Planctomycetes bacterium]|nr:hypothetical protein [Planctomycetota bacterium]